MTSRGHVTRRLLFSATAFAVAAGIVVPAGNSAAATPQPAANAAIQPFRYAIQPGTPQWSRLTSHDAMVKAAQIPTDTIARMSTEQLTTAVLDYPLMIDTFAFNTVQQGVDTVASRFTGMRELLRRPDAGTVLLNRYRALDPSVSPKATLLAAGKHAMEVRKVETLLAQPKVLGSLTGSQLELLLTTGQEKAAVKRNHAKVYAEAGLEPTATLVGRTLAVREGWDWRQSQLLRDGIQLKPGGVAATLAAVTSHRARPTAIHQVTDRLVALDYDSTVKTPNGTSVAVYTMTSELSSADRAAMDNEVRQAYPQATLLRSASRKYNCHSYAWYTSKSSNNRWMNNPDKYWKDDSYSKWDSHAPWVAKMKLTYARHTATLDDDHSGIWVDSNKVYSKWGPYALMQHAPTYSPYDDSHNDAYYRS